ncbi:DUF1294 domain-containing protein [Sandarakinorhabdus sp. AAP62]|uniref:DUF1294 domain-containing protein n=1 Tax=Sandarakinorhabdus sp. AAP62 TaxID=1248916 RepID=UPI0009D98189|nr:DUF1294 domain-containing protein [Sandarakinorhabdus sp. AAP62]
MPLPMIALAAAAASFACEGPTHHDGDNLRCANVPGAMRLQGIDAPEMPGACRPGRRCVDGDPFAARDQLRRLTRGKTLRCTQEDTDNYGRAIVNCTAGQVNISCAMIASGHAVPRYAPLDCADQMLEPQAVQRRPPQTAAVPDGVPARLPERVIVPPDTPAPALLVIHGPGLTLLLVLCLALINAVTWAMFAMDKRRAVAGRSRERISEASLLGWAAVGGSPAAWHAMHRLRHKSSKDSFKQSLVLITGVHGGIVLGGLYWWLMG